MGKLEKDKDGNPVIVVPFHIRHLGPRQSIVLDCGSKFNDVVNEPLPKSIDSGAPVRTNVGIRPIQHRSGTGESAEAGSLLRCQNLVAGQSGPGYNSRCHAGQNASGNDIGKGSK